MISKITDDLKTLYKHILINEVNTINFKRKDKKEIVNCQQLPGTEISPA